jgi:endonuclease YncB( thermonuclease family)
VRRWTAFLVALSLVTALVILFLTKGGGTNTGVVSHVRDGDTVELEGGAVVRLVQIDTPELSENECYARKARALLRRLLPVGTHVRIVEDERLDRVDRYRRRLAYVFKGHTNVNRTLVARGAASIWFFDGRRGRYAPELLAAARRAKALELGLWNACPRTRLDPLGPVDSGVGS